MMVVMNYNDCDNNNNDAIDDNLIVINDRDDAGDNDDKDNRDGIDNNDVGGWNCSSWNINVYAHCQHRYTWVQQEESLEATHCGVVTSYVDTDPGQHWLR